MIGRQQRKNIPSRKQLEQGTEMGKASPNLFDGKKTIHNLFFFEDIVIIQNFKSQRCKVVGIFFTSKGILILEYSKEI